MNSPARVIRPVFRSRLIDVHAADRVLDRGRACLPMSIGGMRVSAMSAGMVHRQIPFGGDILDRRLPLASYTYPGYMTGMQAKAKASCLKRLNRIAGQVRGIVRMVDEDRYCIDVITQVSAVRAALKRVEEEVLRDHVAHCVEHAISAGDRDEQRRKIGELMQTLGKM